MTQNSSEEHRPLLAGVSLVAPPPVGNAHIELKPGVTALYGLNGVGKTKIITAVRELIEELTPSGDAEDPFDSLLLPGRALGAPILAAYVTGGVHLVSPLRANDFSDRWQPEIVEYLRDPETYLHGGSYTWTEQKQASFWSALRQSVRSKAPSLCRCRLKTEQFCRAKSEHSKLGG
jgi:hypothetical protein